MVNDSNNLKDLTEEQINEMTDEQADDMRKWLFKENIRIRELERNLEDERKLIDIRRVCLKRSSARI